MELLNPSPLCVDCPNREHGVRRVETDGLGTNGILVLGEGPWTTEVSKGVPFYGPSGNLLNRCLRRIGLQREDFLIANAGTWCKAPHLGWYARKEAALPMATCRPHWESLIERFKPKVIVTLGDTALRQVCGVSGLTERHAYVHDSPYGVPVVPTFHPSYLLQGNSKLSGVLMYAFRRAVAMSDDGWARLPVRYLLDPSIDDARRYFTEWDERDPIVCDIETPMSGKLDEDEAEQEDDSYTIIRLSFSHKGQTAISMPWSAGYIELAREVLRRAHRVVFWNGGFDVPRLRANGCDINGRIEDAMWAWHFLQSDLPKSLGFVAPFYYDGTAWKHLSDSEPAYYSAVDADATMRCYDGIRRDLTSQGRWEAFERHCTEATPVLQRMGATGLVVDLMRQGEFKGRLETELTAAKLSLQSLVPDAVRPYKDYKRQPKDCQYPQVETADGPRFRKPLEFNPDSPLQVTNLIKSLGLTLPKNRKTGAGSTGAKYLERFAKKQPVFRAILDCRQRADMLGTFIWPTNAAGRVTTQYGFHPSTWRKSSRQVNLQNIPKRADLAKEFRRMLIAQPGHVLIEADSAAIEAVLVGYFANDPDYIRLSKLGVHDFLTSHIVGQPASIDWPDAQLRSYLKGIKKSYKETREAAKRCIHGSNYLLSAHGMNDEYQEFFPTQRKAQEMQDFYFGLFPKVRAWHKATLEQAHKETYLEIPYRYRHYFFSVYEWADGEWRMGTDAKRAVAFRPQATASAVQTEYLLQCEADPDVRDWLRLIIHDSLVLEAPRSVGEAVAQRVYDVMTSPLAELGGLTIGAEVSIGDNLGDMQVWEPEGVTA